MELAAEVLVATASGAASPAVGPGWASSSPGRVGVAAGRRAPDAAPKRAPSVFP